MALLDMRKYLTAAGIPVGNGLRGRASNKGAAPFAEIPDEKVADMLKADLIKPTKVAGTFVLTKEGWKIFADKMLEVHGSPDHLPDGNHRIH